jgi:hypothetical protein
MAHHSRRQLRDDDDLFRLDVGSADHLAPLLGFIGDELSEVDRAHRHRHMAYLSHPRLDLGVDEAGVDLTIERLDDLGRHTTRGDNTNPTSKNGIFGEIHLDPMTRTRARSISDLQLFLAFGLYRH